MTSKPRSAEYLGCAWKIPVYRPCGVRCRGGVTLIQAFVRNLGTCSKMKRENVQAQKRKAESTNASIRGGPPRSSEEVAVIAVERRGWAVQSKLGQPATGGTLLFG